MAINTEQVQKTTNEILGDILSSLTHKYETSLDELRGLENYDIETRTQSRPQKVQEIALDIAQDLTLLASYRLGQDTKYNSYYLKHIDSAIQYLNNMRQTLSLYITSEKL